jgi:hypothetical protein
MCIIETPPLIEAYYIGCDAIVADQKVPWAHRLSLERPFLERLCLERPCLEPTMPRMDQA